MTDEEFMKIAKVLKAYYPSEKFLADDYMMTAWYSQFKDIDYGLCGQAVKAYVQTNKFPPSVSDLRQMVAKLSAPRQLGTLEAWAMVSKAIRNGTYHSVEEFEKLPKAVQKAVGSPENLKNWATTDYKSIETVISSNFQRAYETVVKRESADILMSEDLQMLVNKQNEMLGIGFNEGNEDDE